MVEKQERNKKYILDARAFVADAKKKHLDGAVYCEAKEDTRFWEKVLTEFMPNHKFDFHCYTKTKNSDKSSGKGQVLLYESVANRNFLLCIDSDYDYLLDNLTTQNNPYILQTYTYSIENHWCYAPSLNDFLSKLFEEKINFDFEKFLSDFSKIIYEAFLHTVLSEKSENPYFSRHDLEAILNFNNYGNKNDYLNYINTKLQQKINDFNSDFKQSDFDNLNLFLQRNKGLSPETTYLFLRGHTLFEKVILPIIRSLRDEFLSQKIAALPIENREDHNKKTITKLSQNLQNNLNFANYWQIEKIENDILNQSK